MCEPLIEPPRVLGDDNLGPIHSPLEEDEIASLRARVDGAIRACVHAGGSPQEALVAVKEICPRLSDHERIYYGQRWTLAYLMRAKKMRRAVENLAL